jgi:hypothetical protein
MAQHYRTLSRFKDKHRMDLAAPPPSRLAHLAIIAGQSGMNIGLLVQRFEDLSGPA